MANEEQRKAFASYMGTAGANASPQSPQPTAAFANSGNPYLFQQFPGVLGVPAAPTPPPAAPSSVASFPSYQGGVQGGYPQGGFQFGQQQSAFPQRPPPLSQSEAFPSQQSAAHLTRSSGYIQVPRNYGDQQLPSQPSYNVGWQYTDPAAHSNEQVGSSAATSGAMMPLSRNYSTEIVESRSKHMSEQHHLQEHSGNIPSSPVMEIDVPVLLCHTCSVCKRMRSAGYHRNHPVVPGKPPVSSPCRRCKKKIKNQGRSRSSFTRIRSCTAEQPCNWPRESVHIDVEIDRDERRGRRRSRERVYVYRRSPSRPRVIRQSSSQTRLGLRALQQDKAMPRERMNQTRVRVSSLSPHRASRYDGVWPPPDVVPMRLSRPEKQHMTQTNPNLTSRDEVWPPPDVVRTHSYRRLSVSPLRRQNSRIIELSPSPPPVRRRASRVEIRSESSERRHRSVSPTRVRFREDRQTEAAEARMMAHPQPYRPVVPDRQNMRTSDDLTASMDDVSRSRPSSPGRGILKQPRGYRETPRRQMSMRDSQQSTAVEVGGSRVHFDSSRRDEQAVHVERGRSRHVDDARRQSDEYEHYHDYSRHRYVDDPRPPVEEIERLRVRRSPPSPEQNYEEEVRIDRARRISPSPPRRFEEIRVRHVSPLPLRDRDRTPRPPPSPASPERPAISGFRHVSRAEVPSQVRHRSPPPTQRPVSEDMTDSDSAHSGEITEVRTFRGIDENGQPATFVEERKRARMLEQGSERGSHAEFRPMSERLAMRSWRDV